MSALILGLASPVLIVAALIAATLVILAAIYDLIASQRAVRVKKTINRLRRPSQPSVTILVYSDDQAELLESCIAHINRSQYHAVDIVVISSSVTRLGVQLSRGLQAKSRYPLRTYQMRKPALESESLRRGYARSQKGSFAVSIRPDVLMPTQFIKRAVAQQVQSEKMIAIRFLQRETYEIRIGLLWPMLVSASSLIWQKARQMMGWRTTGLQTGFIFPGTALAGRTNRSMGYRFDSTLRAEGLQAVERRSLVVRLSLILAVALFVVVGCVALGAATLFITRLPFLALYVICCFWIAACIWLDDDKSFSDRLKLSLTIPVGFFIMLAGALVYPLAWIYQQSLMKSRKI